MHFISSNQWIGGHLWQIPLLGWISFPWSRVHNPIPTTSKCIPLCLEKDRVFGCHQHQPFPTNCKNHFVIFFLKSLVSNPSPMLFQTAFQLSAYLGCLQVISSDQAKCKRWSRQCCRILGITIGLSDCRYSILCWQRVACNGSRSWQSCISRSQHSKGWTQLTRAR